MNVLTLQSTYGGLLHDTGKAVYRAGGQRGSHSEQGYQFLHGVLPGAGWAPALDCVRYHHAAALRGAAKTLPADSPAYDQLNKSCTDTISAKMRQLEYKDNIDYNKKAVNAYNSAFTSFKNNESRYKDKSQLFGLVSTTLFAYDAGRLFNETLIFYNHVYSYIFSKLDDNGKLELTRYSIECERKLR